MGHASRAWEVCDRFNSAASHLRERRHAAAAQDTTEGARLLGVAIEQMDRELKELAGKVLAAEMRDALRRGLDED